MTDTKTEISKLPFGLSLSETIGLAILIILYAVGIFGIGRPELRSQILMLTPVQLTLSFAIALWFDPKPNKRLIIALLIAFGVGFGIEILGVATGVIFGEYQYGAPLGPQLWDTPIMIGVNWAMLVYLAFSTINLFFSRWKVLFKTIYASLTLVFFDYVMEPVAMELNFWNWSNDIIPFQNYIAWAVISFVLLYFFFSFLKSRTNKIAYALLIIQFIFFTILNIRLLG